MTLYCKCEFPDHVPEHDICIACGIPSKKIKTKCGCKKDFELSVKFYCENCKKYFDLFSNAISHHCTK